MQTITDKLNRPIKDLRISVMDTCNYRCPYCMPAEQFDDNYPFLKPNERLSFDEITQIVKVFAGFGVNKIRLTGGEPLLRKNLAELIAQIKTIDGIEDIALTTNGQLLKKQLPDLLAAGLDRINVSLDTIDEDLYHSMSGNKGHLEGVLQAIELAKNSPLKSVKLNCVVQLGVNDKHIMPLLKKYQDSRVVVRFIEFMDVGTKNNWQNSRVMPFSELLKQIESAWKLMPLEPNYAGEVATRYRYQNHIGEIGFITSISKPFCRDCSRARLSADGKLYTCLFANHGFDLRQYIRGKQHDYLADYIKNIWQNREDRYSELRQSQDSSNKGRIEMYVIGG